MVVQAVRIDPVTFEVIRNKLRAMLADQATTLQNVSGSPVVTEAPDFNTGLYMKDSGLCLEAGVGMVLAHVESLGSMVRSVTQDLALNPGIHEGDQFFCNDPWKGALHQNDVGVLAPIFYRGELVAWSGALAHQLDVGGMEFGSWCPKATSVFQEGAPIPPIQLVDHGRVRTDVWNMLMAHTRLPFLVGLDLKALIAANNVLIRRFTELADRYGLGVVQAVMDGMLEETERRLRERLRELPDGIFRGVDYLDHDGHENRLYRVAVAVHKQGDTLRFDFTGTSPQAPGHINCTEPGMVGGVAAAILPRLCWDIPWNGGIYKVFTAYAPKGTVINCTFPAPTSAASTSAVQSVTMAVQRAFNQLFACSEKYQNQVIAAGGGGAPILNLDGLNQFGEPFGTMLLDHMASGTAGLTDRDGAGGSSMSVRANIADVETNENFAPILYLYRKLIPDSGGPGKWRGGQTAGLAFMLHDVDSLNAVLMGKGSENTVGGASGGLPGANNLNMLVRDSDMREKLASGKMPENAAELAGDKRRLGARPGAFPFGAADVFEYTWNGGLGYGDPLERDPELVLQDVRNGAVTVEWARKLFGVVIDAGSETAVLEATRLERVAIRQSRLKFSHHGSSTPQREVGHAVRLLPMGKDLEIIEIEGTALVCCRCGYQFGPASQNWKQNAPSRAVLPAEVGPLVALHEDLEMRAYYCPGCGLQHCVETVIKGEPPLWDVELTTN